MSEPYSDEELAKVETPDEIDLEALGMHEVVGRLKATVDKFRGLWERSNKVAEDYREQCIEMAEIHKKICEQLTANALEVAQNGE